MDLWPQNLHRSVKDPIFWSLKVRKPLGRFLRISERCTNLSEPSRILNRVVSLKTISFSPPL